MDKMAKVLECIIIEYIRNSEPIGSEILKERFSLPVSSATIRNYFKKMSDDGLLVKLHISGGRVPTDAALIAFWQNRFQKLSPIKVMDFGSLEDEGKKHKVCSLVKFQKPNRLNELHEVGSKYIIAAFDDGEVVLKHSSQMLLFLSEFLGSDIKDILAVARRYQVVHLQEKLESLLNRDSLDFIDGEELIDIASHHNQWARRYLRSFMSGYIIDELRDGIYFAGVAPEGYMLIKNEAVINNKKADFLCIGQINRNFEDFINSIQ